MSQETIDQITIDRENEKMKRDGAKAIQKINQPQFSNKLNTQNLQGYNGGFGDLKINIPQQQDDLSEIRQNF